ncbi:MAG: hypothetical protein JNM93_04815 [Bacteriovoracaceae bacterium]|nr:hypothetical protein [Bacteriovoracaceae bacterium]
MLKIIFFFSLVLSFSAYAQRDIATLEAVHNDLSEMGNNKNSTGLRVTESGVLDRGDLVHNIAVMLEQMAKDANLKPNAFYKMNISDITDMFGLESFRLEQFHYYVELLFERNHLVRPNKSITSWEALKENIHFLKINGSHDLNKKLVDNNRSNTQKANNEIKSKKSWHGCEEY